MRNVAVNASDLVFLWDDCKRCFALQVLHGIRRPSVFQDETYSVADAAMKRAFADAIAVDLGVGPVFQVLSQGVHVRSTATDFPELDLSIRVEGVYDALVATEHSELAVVDYKTTTADELSLRRYWRQLAAYAHALEHPSLGAPVAVDIEAILAYRPAAFAYRVRGVSGLYGRTAWIELPRNRERFRSLLHEVAETIGACIPDASPACRYCAYRSRTRHVPDVGSLVGASRSAGRPGRDAAKREGTAFAVPPSPSDDVAPTRFRRVGKS